MSGLGEVSPRSRYEFRVWGERDDTYKRLSELADVDRTEEIDDCYLLVRDAACNAKIRRSRLKVKRLVEVRSGFQRWSTTWLRSAADAPEPLEGVLAELFRKERTAKAQKRALLRAVDAQKGVRAVFVTKHRRLFRFGSLRAEAVRLHVGGQSERLSTIAIEGNDLTGLVELRSTLGLTDVPNVALHLAIDPQAAIHQRSA